MANFLKRNRSARALNTTECLALQAEATHGATYLAMLTERAVALSRLMGLPENMLQIHLHDFRDKNWSNEANGSSLWSQLHHESHVALPSGLEIRLFSRSKVRIRQRIFGRLSQLLVHLKSLMALRSAHRSIAKTCEVLRLKSCGVVIGDLVLSTALRMDPGSVAGPHRSRMLAALLAEGATRAAFAAKRQDDLENAEMTGIWCTPEASYLQAVLPRAATQKRPGLQLVDDATGMISLIYAKNLDPIPPLLIVPAEGRTDRAWASQNLHSRLEALDRRTEEEASKNIFLEANQNRSHRIDVVVFLHDFADGEFMNGFDGLGSNYQWAEFTLSHLVHNSDLQIYVKPHPATQVESKFGRKVSGLLASLQSDTSESINWLPPHQSPQTQVRLGSSVGITRYGTVAEELTFRGIPVVASKNAPYAAHNFATHWADLESYSELLHELPQIASRGVLTSQRDACLDYVYRRHSQWGPPFWERAVKTLAEIQELPSPLGSWYELEDFLQLASPQAFYDLVRQTSYTCPVIDRRSASEIAESPKIAAS